MLKHPRGSYDVSLLFCKLLFYFSILKLPSSVWSQIILFKRRTGHDFKTVLCISYKATLKVNTNINEGELKKNLLCTNDSVLIRPPHEYHESDMRATENVATSIL